MLEVLRRFGPLLRPYRARLLLGGVLVLVVAALELAMPWPLKVVVDDALNRRAPGGLLGEILGPWSDSPTAVLAICALALVVSLALYFLHGITLRYLALLLTIAAAAMAHAAIGLVIALKARDFSGTLGGVMLFIMLIFVPAILLETGLIPRGWTWPVMLSPSAAATEALNYAAKTTGDLPKAAAGLAYLGLLAGLLYRFVVLRLFRSHASVG